MASVDWWSDGRTLIFTWVWTQVFANHSSKRRVSWFVKRLITNGSTYNRRRILICILSYTSCVCFIDCCISSSNTSMQMQQLAHCTVVFLCVTRAVISLGHSMKPYFAVNTCILYEGHAYCSIYSHWVLSLHPISFPALQFYYTYPYLVSYPSVIPSGVRKGMV